MSRALHAASTVIALLIFAGVFAWIWSGCRTASAPTQAAADLAADVRFDGARIVVTNNDSSTWTDVLVSLNPGLIDSGYYWTCRRLAAGESKTVAATDFATSSGERFNPFAVKARDVSVTATCGGQLRFAHLSFPDAA